MLGLSVKIVLIAIALALSGVVLGVVLQTKLGEDRIVKVDNMLAKQSSSTESGATSTVVTPTVSSETQNVTKNNSDVSSLSDKTSSTEVITIPQAGGGGGGINSPTPTQNIRQLCTDANLTEDDYAALQSGGEILADTQAVIDLCIKAGGPGDLGPVVGN